ncbi:hypothetical protein DPMN_156815 [Dreissena polymorpha]|uniref:Uncharacterized protein n=1 Tax=Dreissena polymorpha TaxID=45954 RepID=A0A9D4FTU5_DREPO|nr:hypothetical protein DPMN_156815 [Dreissena polymorpha]
MKCGNLHVQLLDGKFQLAEIGQTCSSVLEMRADRGSYGWNNQHIDKYTLLTVRGQIDGSCLQVQNPIFLSPNGVS